MVLLLAGGVAILGCELTADEHPPRTEGTHQLTPLGSLGNSLTAGYINGGIKFTGQLACFPNLLSQVMTGRSLQMPLVGEPGLGSESGMSPLYIDETGALTREPLTQDPTLMAMNLTYPVPYDNLGVPGATTNQILNVMAGDEADNALFDLILRNSALPGGGTCMGQMERIAPDILTAWSGNNEILGGALSGSPQSDDPLLPGYVVPLAAFQADFVEMCDRIEAMAPEMVAVANIPPITAIPYTRFFGTGSVPGVNRWVMEEDLDGDDDPVQLVLLHSPISDCVQCYLPSCQFDPQTPCDTIPADATLTVAETALIDGTIADYNAFIATEVADRGWALVDINTAFLALPTSSDDGPANVIFPWLVNPMTGVGTQNVNSAFTLDGVHPSEKGAAVVANEFLAAFNATYGTTYEMVDVEAIDNVVGFELAPAAEKIAGGRIRFTETGRQGLRAMADMMAVRH